MLRPFAVQLLDEYLNGKSLEQLSRETGIPAARILMRLKAAFLYLGRSAKKHAA